MLITLTDNYNDGAHRGVQADDVQTVFSKENITTIIIKSDPAWLWVTESVEEVIKLVNEALERILTLSNPKPEEGIRRYDIGPPPANPIGGHAVGADQ